MQPVTAFWAWMQRHDPGLGALRRAGRAAIVMPAMFALGDKVIGNPTLATFAAFGSFALLMLVGFGGPMRDRLQAQVTLAVAGAVLICIATAASRWAWVAAIAMAVVAFAVIFAGVVSSVLAGATTALLLAFILPVTTPGPISSIPIRLAGWGLASLASLLAVSLLWPAPSRDPLRAPAARASRALARRLRADVAVMLGAADAPDAEEHHAVIEQSDAAMATLQRVFLATPYRPTGLSTPARTLVRLVDELSWVNAIAVQRGLRWPAGRPHPAACAVRLRVAALLEGGADLLDGAGADQAVDAASQELRDALGRLEDHAAVDGPHVEDFLSSLEPSFRAQELSFAALQIADNITLTVAAEGRSWPDRLLGRQPRGLAGPLAAAQERALAHVDRHSVWLHNSIRGAVGLGLAVLVADLSGVQHSFWVVLATLSVLRSNALNTGQNAVRGLLGTIAGFIVGAGVLAVIGTNTTVLWMLLPVVILIAGIAPAAISFAAGQAAFTLTLVILFNIVAPTGWHVGLIRVEDIGIGCGVSLAVGLLFWPRGAAAALGRALAEAYTDTAHYLTVAVEFGLQCCEAGPPGTPGPAPPSQPALLAAAASRRLDDAFRSYLAERGSKPVALAQVTAQVSGVVGLRLAADAVLDLWQRAEGSDEGDRSAARLELLQSSQRVEKWYDALATSFVSEAVAPPPLAHDRVADGRLLDAVRRDLSGRDGAASATAARMIWTGDHLDAARRLQETLVQSPQGAAAT